MSTEQSWNLTPREYSACVDVYKQQHLQRWALERSMFANAHFRGKDDPAWEPGDFIGESTREDRRAQIIRDQRDLALARLADSKISAAIGGTNAATRTELDAFEWQSIPKWARMTDEEKQQRGHV